jgi:hypothetical protein
MLSDPHFPGRREIYDLLIEIAGGYAPDEHRRTISTGESLPLRIACFRAVDAGTKTYDQDLMSSDVDIRNKAKYLLDLLKGE